MKGFTLVELLVASTIFLIIVLAITSPLSELLQYQRASQNKNSLRDNLQFMVNVMDKEFRTARNPVVNEEQNNLTFVNQSNQTITYNFDENGTFTRENVLLADQEVMEIRRVKFILRGGTGPLPTRLTVIIAAEATDGQDSTVIQSTTLLRNR